MTVLVYDGTHLATDTGATDGRVMWETTKAWYHNAQHPTILSGVGSLKNILLMRDWYINGADKDKFPTQQTGNYRCDFVVVTEEGLLRYEDTYIPIEHGKEPCAFGHGRDFAYGVLAMGGTAEQAVQVANKYSVDCGIGVALYSLDKCV